MFVASCSSNAQMGKDTLCNYLVQRLNETEFQDVWERGAFADNVKKVFCDMFDVDREFVEKWKVIDECPPGFDMPVRKGLQFIGDGFRKIKSNIWIDLCFREDKEDGICRIFADGRYPNEWKKIKHKKGVNILIGRTDLKNDDINDSEALVRPYVEWGLNNLEEFDIISEVDISSAPPLMNCFDIWVRNDGSVQELYDKIDQYVLPYIVKQYNFGLESDILSDLKEGHELVKKYAALSEEN